MTGSMAARRFICRLICVVSVVADGYRGSRMAHIMRSLRSHYESPEELIFDSMLRFVHHNSLVVELGSF
jgi:hypothetical protein